MLPVDAVFGLAFNQRRNLAKEILRLSPPQPGCEQRARFILERKFTLEELWVLAEALRDGFGDTAGEPEGALFKQ